MRKHFSHWGDRDDYYRRDIESLPRLSRAQEAELFREYRKNPAPELRDRIVRQYLLWTSQLAHRHCGPRFQYAEAVSAANLGLMKAIEKYDPDGGYAFLYVSYGYIRAAIIDAQRQHSYLLNVRSPLRVAREEYRKAGMTLEAEKRLQERRTEIFESVNKVGQLPVDFSERPAVDEGDTERLDAAALLRLIVAALDNPADTEFSERERSILRLRYLSGGDRLKTFPEIGRILKLSLPTLRHYHDLALAKFRARFKNDKG